MYQVQGIIFDLDGTLVSLPIDWSMGIKQVEQLLGIEIKSLLDVYPEIWGTQKYEIISRAVEGFERASLDRFEILDESPALLLELSTKYLLGLVTFQGQNIVDKILNQLGIRNITVATRDDAPTRLEQIAQIISSTPLKPLDFLVVGDRLNDVYSARKLGCHAILVDRRNRFDTNRINNNFTVIPNLKPLPTLLGTT